MSGIAEARILSRMSSFEQDLNKSEVVGGLGDKMRKANQLIDNAATEALQALMGKPNQPGKGTQGKLTDIGRTAITNINKQAESKKREIGAAYLKVCDFVQKCKDRVKMEEKAEPAVDEMKKLANEGVKEIKEFLKAPADEACNNLDKIRDPDQESEMVGLTKNNRNTNIESLQSEDTINLF